MSDLDGDLKTARVPTGPGFEVENEGFRRAVFRQWREHLIDMREKEVRGDEYHPAQELGIGDEIDEQAPVQPLANALVGQRAFENRI